MNFPFATTPASDAEPDFSDEAASGQGLEDSADVDCTTPPGWTPPEVFDDLSREEH